MEIICVYETIGLLQDILCEVKTSNKALWEKVGQLEKILKLLCQKEKESCLLLGK